MINTVVFDVGMVLVEFRSREYLKEFNYSKEVYDKIVNAMFLSKDWLEFDRSLLSDEEILESFIKNAPECDNEIREVFENLGNAICTYDYTKEWIKDLKENGYKVYILSNYPKKIYELSRKQLEFIHECDGAVFSFEVKKIKPEPEIFYSLMDKYHFKSEEAVFLDDNESNIEAAKKLGFKTIHFISKDQAVEELNKFFI